MATPLYRNHDRTKNNPNMGLWWAKYFHLWKTEFLKGTDRGKDKALEDSKNSKRDWLEEFRKAGNDASLDEYTKRCKRMVETQGGSAFSAITNSRLIVGLGHEHPIENGFTWHHTLGVPYLPASSIKGMVRMFAVQWADNTPSPEDLVRIFGSHEWTAKGEDKDSPEKRLFGSFAQKQGVFQVGSVIFLDATPTAPVTLESEIQTVHYGPWYKREENSTEVPADWHSPTPIPFLAIAENTTFQFAVMPRIFQGEAAEKTIEDCERVMALLKDSLEYFGIGAKTAVGYGRFRINANQR